MTHHILPRLTTDNNVQAINQPGTWAVRSRDLLDKLRKGLKVDKVETEINSIPDMWARPMLFEMALFDDQHVLHERILGEWRGLLAMIALKEVAKLNRLTVTQVQVPIPTPLPEGEQETEAQQRDFMRTLSKLVPGTSLSTDTTWRTLYVFLFNGQPIGMTSPTTLVATATDYLNRISNQDVAWYNGTHLKDPVGILSPRQKQILSGWLSQLKAHLALHSGVNVRRWNRLSGLLKDFTDELGAGSCSLNQGGLGIAGQEAGIFKYLDKPADGNIQAASHVRLLPSKGRSPAKPLLVLDRGIAEQWNMSPQNVTVDGTQTLASAQVQVPNSDVWKAAEFFTKKLFVVFQENAFRGTLGGGNQSLKLPGGSALVTPIIPLKWKLMEHLTAEDLARCVQWEQAPEGLKIRLWLRLSGPEDGDNAKPATEIENGSTQELTQQGANGIGTNADSNEAQDQQDANEVSGRMVELTKVYGRNDIHELSDMPILEVWPDFKAAGWKAYYTCYSTDDVSNTFTAKPYTPAIIAADESERQLGGRRLQRYWRTNTYPEAMICRAAVPNTQTNQIETLDAGLLLLTQPQEVQRQGQTYKVGIDFGASSTTICARGQRSFVVKFANRKVSVTATGAAKQAQLFDFFLPRVESEMPVLSFFQDFNNKSNSRALRPFLDGHAYLLETAELFDPANTKGLAYDLKWSRDENDRTRVQAFLTQLCLQAAAELVAMGATGAAWAFSYPTAFSGKQTVGFPRIWDQVTADCAASSGLDRLGPNIPHTESEATAFYFVSRHSAATPLGTIFIDIGGSTSDISIWQENKPVWQTSVLLAGRSIFSNYLWYHPDFLTSFGVDVSRLQQLKQNSGDDRRPYHALTDALLRYNSEEIFKYLPVQAGSDQVSSLRQHLALGVCGLLYYVGSLLQYLCEKEYYRQAIPNLYVGGNGSRIFKWLDVDEDRRINSLYRAVFSHALGWPEVNGFDVILSKEPKLEAAYGLVSGINLKGGNQHQVLAGESFVAEESIKDASTTSSSGGKPKVSPEELDWKTILTAGLFTKRLLPPQILHRLADFVNSFNQSAEGNGLDLVTDFGAEQISEVRRRLSTNLSRYQGEPETANIVVEPVFIVALRHWLEIRLGG